MTDQQQRDAELAALEAAAVAAATGALAARLARIGRSLLDGWLLVGSPRWWTVRRAAARELASLRPGVAAAVGRMLPAAARAGARWAGAPLPAGHDVRDDPGAALLLDTADSRIRDKLARAAAVVRARVDTRPQLEHALARTDAARVEAETVAGDLVAHAVAAGTRAAAEAAGREVTIEAEPTACLSCASMAGSTPDADGLFRPVRVYTDRLIPWLRDGVTAVPLHPNCLVGDTHVSSRSRITGATSRVFEGEVVSIRTLRGKQLTATPNHPVLTSRGWVPIGLISEGDQVVCDISAQWPLGGDDDNDDVPPRIDQVAEAFLRSGKVATREVPVSPEDFHGDGSGSEVAVVGSDRCLPLPARQHLRDEVLQRRSSGAGRLPCASLGDGMFRALLHATNSVVCCGGKALAFLRGGVRHAHEHGCATPPGINAGHGEDSANGGSGDGIALRDELLALTGEVALDDVVSVRRNPWSGHVYNLETADGWYISNGIATHNCRCRVVVTTPGLVGRLRRKAQRDVASARSLHDSAAEVLRAVDEILGKRGPRVTGAARRAATQTRARGRSSPRDGRGLQQAG